MAIPVKRLEKLIELKELGYVDGATVDECRVICPNCGKLNHLIIIFWEPNIYNLPEGSVVCYECAPKLDKTYDDIRKDSDEEVKRLLGRKPPEKNDGENHDDKS